MKVTNDSTQRQVNEYQIISSKNIHVTLILEYKLNFLHHLSLNQLPVFLNIKFFDLFSEIIKNQTIIYLLSIISSFTKKLLHSLPP